MTGKYAGHSCEGIWVVRPHKIRGFMQVLNLLSYFQFLFYTFSYDFSSTVNHILQK